MAHRNAMCAMALVGLSLTACDDDDGTEPDTMGRAQAFVVDHPDRQSSPAVQAAPGPLPAAAFSGSITSNTNAAVSTSGQTWIDLGSPNGITIRLHNADSTTVHGEVSVPVGTYARVRLTLRNAQARFAAGGSVGGVTLTSELTMTLGGSDGEVVIEKPVQPFEIRTGVRTAIVFELNSEVWATAQNRQDRVVEDAEVQQAATVVVRTAAGS